MPQRSRPSAFAPLLLAFALACAHAASPEPQRYRLAHSGTHWDVVGGDAVFADLEPRYNEFFEVILDPEIVTELDLRVLRDDLERQPVERRNFDALNSIAIAYFETNYRAEAGRGEGLVYLSLSQRAAQLLAVPWRAYAETDDAGLRGAILDFFEDAGSGEKLNSAATAPRLVRIVASLERKESDPQRRARIQQLTERLRAISPEGS